MSNKDAAISEGAAGRALDVFEAFAVLREPMSLTELSVRIGAPLSSCHALVRTLQNRGYIYVLDQRRRFYPSKRMFEIASAIATNDPLMHRLLPILTTLRDQTGETVIVGKRQGDEVIYLEVIEGTHVIRYQEKPGARKPLHSSAVGKAMLGVMDDDALSGFLHRHKLVQMTDQTIVGIDLLMQDLRDSRERGYYMTRGENVPDVQAISTVCHFAGETLAVALAGPIFRMQKYLSARIKALRTCHLKVESLNASLV